VWHREITGEEHRENEGAYSIIAVMILNMTYMARLTPEAPCSVLLGEEEWKLLYRVANKKKQEVQEPYSMKEAVKYLGWLGGPKRAPRDGPPGVKTIYSAGLPVNSTADFI
jgi:hypothetical protein